MKIAPLSPPRSLSYGGKYERKYHHGHAPFNKRLAKRSTLPSLNSATSTASTTGASTSSASTSGTSLETQESETFFTLSATISSSMATIDMTTLVSNSTTAMPTVSTTSSSSSTTSTSYTYQATVPTDNAENPYISRESLPVNSVFIIVGALLGALALGIVLSWLVVWWKSRKRAKREKEVQYYNPFHYDNSSNSSATHLLAGSLGSSFLEKSTASVNTMFSDPTSLGMGTSTPGRSYREMLNSMGRRGSMTISPVLEMMRSSASNLDLPLFHPAPDAPVSMPRTPVEISGQSNPTSRPPSRVLDDMLAAIEFSADYPETRENTEGGPLAPQDTNVS
ncbi:hypothetical protein METBIDRAFT_45706 [Metschnikowia bicuspidata var. bicuspidata NRRL YB-4993]|uniref:Uncharacterized protein n=1 Tax=Metschnikowia bicuspidata var. bicuspidata NRRL YB-4993 TaxID=869754 RepID=A0A1A0H6Y5_9ASCO|nr:hypothetical protein METBIDRAFT_45706 [Metschnikowia bicuspidata var. bicuspidata NRRL YB-4993]OBA19668.1 hypothetical protein METBIDRAFT_45706 [Metschnikowia bicuspidata var. bicuspidata NRRL YB-4993]